VDVRWEKTELGENCLTVQDTGIGCSSELLKHIFDPFVVEDSKRNDENPSVGVGKIQPKMKKHEIKGWLFVESVTLCPNIVEKIGTNVKNGCVEAQHFKMLNSSSADNLTILGVLGFCGRHHNT